MNTIKNLLISMRPKQWTKNLIVFAAVAFAGKIFDAGLLLDALYAFIIFCVVSGCDYVINDVIDRKKDVFHPDKKKRPIVAGELSSGFALVFAVFFVCVCLVWAYSISVKFSIIVLAYFLIMILYTLWLKNMVIVDVLVISIGFVMRAVAGAYAVNVKISSWLLVVTILLALFLILSKRRNELVSIGDASLSQRPVLKEYSVGMLDQFIGIVASSTIIVYSLYSFYSETAKAVHTRFDIFLLNQLPTRLMITVPFVIYGIFRYLYLVYKKNLGGNPEIILLTDFPLIANILLWIGLVFLIIYM